ncbi:MAG: thioredoxin family protein [Deltaproteobacteria bacterium]|nr:thioredoxin family protein [Deltaproteobacteria bacterium]
MALTPSTMLELRSPAPAFRLPDTRGEMVSLDDYVGAPAYLVVFICNHCPYVIHIRGGLSRFYRDYANAGLGMVAINANDVATHPQDGPEQMAVEAQRSGYEFPYLYDETQEVAKAYQAACTPDFFLFDAEARLVYRGQFDDSRPGNDIPVTGEALRSALDAVLEGKPVDVQQKASLGCNIKWRVGNEPSYS